LAAAVLALVVTGCASTHAVTATSTTLLPCSRVAAQCHAKRLPNRVLKDDQRSGALGAVDGYDLQGLISFDAALRRGWEEDGQTAKTVQVVLGSANADALHWPGNGPHLYYAVLWTGVRLCSSREIFSTGSNCALRDWGTVIDVHTGAFIVGGTG